MNTPQQPQHPWLASYPAGVPAQIDEAVYPSLLHMLEQCFAAHAGKAAYSYLGADFRFEQIDRLSQQLGAYFQSLGLQAGERIALMMPNIPQYPVAMAAVLRAGYVVVNVNPLYTARELEHQLHDSGAKAIVILENFATTLQACIAHTAIEHVLLCAMGDMLPWGKALLVNTVVRHVKKLVPPFELPQAAVFNDALEKGQTLTLTRPNVSSQDIAVLQYTGGTTGAAKGAVLLHKNIVANVLQSEAWNEPAMRHIPPHVQRVTVCALPLYHIYAFTVCMMRNIHCGGKMILIPNARDLDALLAELSKQTFHCFPGVNTLFNGLMHHPKFDTVNWRQLALTVGGGAAVQSAVAAQWLEKTGSAICEGYGLSETSGGATCNPTDSRNYTASIGVPLPSTELICVDDNGAPVPQGSPGEIAIRGPQVMAGYWQRPDETAKAMTADGFLKTGDIGTMDERGWFKIVDRKKDMIVVSGFKVFPNEVEDVVMQCPGVLECAVVGMPDAQTGEAVRLVVVKSNPALTAETLIAHCRTQLTAYKVPKHIEFASSLPKTPIGKILRRELRLAPSSP
jgi:long-chain acyl-CoA synthetase